MKIPSSFPRFAVVGITATFIHVTVAVALIEWNHWHPGIVNGIAFVVANLFSYAANTRWSFQTRISAGSWYRFVLVSIVAWLLTIAISWSVEAAGWPYLLGILLVVSLIPLLSYIGHRNFTYRHL
jgi:putative flippase GtrA